MKVKVAERSGMEKEDISTEGTENTEIGKNRRASGAPLLTETPSEDRF
jgi:hypothetical protein